jgi:hypothetical protein
MANHVTTRHKDFTYLSISNFIEIFKKFISESANRIQNNTYRSMFRVQSVNSFNDLFTLSFARSPSLCFIICDTDLLAPSLTYLSIRPHAHPSIDPSIHPSIHIYIYTYIHACIHLHSSSSPVIASIHPSMHLPVSLPIHTQTSIHQSVSHSDNRSIRHSNLPLIHSPSYPLHLSSTSRIQDACHLWSSSTVRSQCHSSYSSCFIQ